jgi:hypothetical protein
MKSVKISVIPAEAGTQKYFLLRFQHYVNLNVLIFAYN